MASSASKTTFDCVTCGACCTNPDENRETGYAFYVEIGKRDRILRKPELVKKLVVQDPDGIPHMRLRADHRCVALKGPLGSSVSCSIYEDRPACCRRVQPGDAECRKYRKERGIGAA